MKLPLLCRLSTIYMILLTFKLHQPRGTLEDTRMNGLSNDIVGIYDSCSTNQLTTRN